jgi:hypothetical protein
MKNVDWSCDELSHSKRKPSLDELVAKTGSADMSSADWSCAELSHSKIKPN